MPEPTLGRTVHYRLSASDAEAINRRRRDYRQNTKPTKTGFVAHVGNEAVEGQVCPAVIVRVWESSVNLQVLLDGADCFWATSCSEGGDPGRWTWPEVR